MLVEAEAGQAHAKAAEFDVNIGAGAECVDRCGPPGKHFSVLTGIGTDPDRAAHMIEDNPRFWKDAREIGQFVDLKMVEPGVEGEAESAEDGEPFPEGLLPSRPGGGL
jgi:hypothetical protein